MKSLLEWGANLCCNNNRRGEDTHNARYPITDNDLYSEYENKYSTYQEQLSRFDSAVDQPTENSITKDVNSSLYECNSSICTLADNKELLRYKNSKYGSLNSNFYYWAIHKFANDINTQTTSTNHTLITGRTNIDSVKNARELDTGFHMSLLDKHIEYDKKLDNMTKDEKLSFLKGERNIKICK
jgi:hypothetical protein